MSDPDHDATAPAPPDLVAFRRSQCPAGWSVDCEGWFWRARRPTDVGRIAQHCLRAFTTAEHIYCGEPEDCAVLDAPPATAGA
jgi:hypothetical protein